MVRLPPRRPALAPDPSAAGASPADKAPKAAADKSGQSGDAAGESAAEATPKKGFLARLFGP